MTTFGKIRGNIEPSERAKFDYRKKLSVCLSVENRRVRRVRIRCMTRFRILGGWWFVWLVVRDRYHFITKNLWDRRLKHQAPLQPCPPLPLITLTFHLPPCVFPFVLSPVKEGTRRAQPPWFNLLPKYKWSLLIIFFVRFGPIFDMWKIQKTPASML